MFDKLCIVTALEIEFKTAVGLLAEISYSNEAQMRVGRGQCDKRQVTVLKSEVGARGFAKRLAGHLKNSSYDALLVAGLAGGLDPKLKTGDAVVYDLCHNATVNNPGHNSREKQSGREENARIVCDADLSSSIMMTLKASGYPCFSGAGVTVDRIINRAQDKTSLGIQHNALAVDMETYHVISVCAGSGLGAAALRIISDEAGNDLPDFNLALRPDGTMSVWGVTSAMLMSPLASISFLLNLRSVINALRNNLEVILKA